MSEVDVSWNQDSQYLFQFEVASINSFKVNKLKISIYYSGNYFEIQTKSQDRLDLFPTNCWKWRLTLNTFIDLALIKIISNIGVQGLQTDKTCATIEAVLQE